MSVYGHNHSHPPPMTTTIAVWQYQWRQDQCLLHIVIPECSGALIHRWIDFASNTVPPDKRSFPEGSDVEVFTIQALERAHLECIDKHDREHVTFHFWKYDNGFNTVLIKNEKDISNFLFNIANCWRELISLINN